MTGDQMTERRPAYPETPIGNTSRVRSLQGEPRRGATESRHARPFGLRGMAAVAVLAFGLAAAIPGARTLTAQAAGPTESGPLTVCINQYGSIRALLPGSQCPSGQQQVTLNLQGPQGDPGPAGPAGPQGSPGLSNGPAGGDLVGAYPNPTLRQPSLSGITQQPRPPAAAIDCRAVVLAFCGNPSMGYYWNQPADGVTSWAGVYTDAFGFVHLQGTVQRVGNAPWTIFVLPPGARPHGALFFLAMDLNGTTTRPVSIHIADNGEVIEMGDAQPGDLISLSGITFHP